MIRISAGGKLQLSSHTCQPPVICYYWMVPFPEYIPCDLLQWFYSTWNILSPMTCLLNSTQPSTTIFSIEHSLILQIHINHIHFAILIIFSFSLNFWSLSWHTTYLGNHLGFLESWSLGRVIMPFHLCIFRV